MSGEIITLKLDSITVDQEVQIRIGGLNEDKVREYAEVVDQLPPVDVFLENGTYWLGDGFHRFEAHKRARCTEIQARVQRGSRKAAAEHSVLANARHGLPMNRAEKKRAVKRMLRFHPDWSNNRLARSIGVDDKTVARYRAELVSTSEIGKVTAREGADGKTRQVPVKAHARQALAPPEPEPVEICLHGLRPEYCAICRGEELPDDEGDEIEICPVSEDAGIRPPPYVVRQHSQRGTAVAAGQHCPHCGDGRGEEICSFCSRRCWSIKFSTLERYLRALRLLEVSDRAG